MTMPHMHGSLVTIKQLAWLVLTGIAFSAVARPAAALENFIETRYRAVSHPVGSYVLGVPPVAERGSGIPLSCSDTVMGQLFEPTDAIQYEFEGEAGKWIEVLLSEKTGPWKNFSNRGPVATLTTPSGIILYSLATAFGGDLIRRDQLSETGTYVLQVTANAPGDINATGTYNLSLICTQGPGDVALACGEIVSEEIAEEAEADLYSFFGEAGARVQITVVETGGTWATLGNEGPVAALYDPDGQVLFEGEADMSGVINREFELTETGIHTIRIRSSTIASASGFGDYNISVNCLLSDIHQDLVCNDLLDSESLIVPGEIDLFNFDGVDGEQVQFTLAETSGNWAAVGNEGPVLTVWSPSGLVIQTPVEVGMGGSFFEEYILDETGTYSVRVSPSAIGNDNSTGFHNLGFYCLSEPAQLLACGETVSDGILLEGEVDTYELEAGAGDTLKLILNETSGPWSSTGNEGPVVTVFSPSGLVLLSAEVDSSGSTTQEFTAPQDGSYTVRIQSSNIASPDTTGFYTLELRCMLNPDGDADVDFVPNGFDNCVFDFNPTQLDSDDDGIGNLCDGDFDQNCRVDFDDLRSMKDMFFFEGDSPKDMNGDGAVNFLDLELLKRWFFVDYEAENPSGIDGNLCFNPNIGW